MSSTAAQLVSNWGANRLNELRVQYARAASRRGPAHEGTPSGISVNITQRRSAFGHPTSDGEDFVQGITQVLDNFTLIRGRHSFKVGFDFQFVADTRAVPLHGDLHVPDGRGLPGGAEPAPIPRGYTTFAQVIGDPNFKMNSQLFSAFWQDDWRLTSDLKLLYGVRYDSYFYPTANASAPFSYSQSFKDDTNNSGPRLGVAWTLGEKKDQVIRASTGIMYDQPLLAVYENAIQQNGLPARTTYSVAATGRRRAGVPEHALEPAAGRGAAGAVDLRAGSGSEAGLQHPEQRAVRARLRPVVQRVGRRRLQPRLQPAGHHQHQPRSTRSGSWPTAAASTARRSTPARAWIRASTTSTSCSRRASPPTRRCCSRSAKRSTSGVQYDLNYTLGKGIDTAPLAGATLSVQGDQPRSDPQDLAARQGAERARHAPLVQRQHRRDVAVQPWTERPAQAPQRQPGRRHPAVQQRPAVHADQQPRSERSTATTATGR